MTTYDVWSEGYAATGERGAAQFHGTYEADTFAEACEKAVADFHGSEKEKERCFDKEKLTYWCCRFFDNAADARKAYG